mmetsp:Transcript_57732/g.122814  ORF Transcript_57732/g.122814 Transcript_57732/m.122814 type:complete len:794 (-) Transcript_57732:368-2749(-)
MVHRPTPSSVVAPRRGSRSSITLNECEVQVPIPEVRKDEWMSQDFYEVDDVGEEENNFISLEEDSGPRGASFRSHLTHENSACSKGAAEDLFAHGDPKRFSYLLAELASEYCLVSGHNTDISQIRSQFNFHHSSTMSTTLDVSGPGMQLQKLGSQKSFVKEDAAAKWESLTRNIINMQSSSVYNVRDYWQYKSWSDTHQKTQSTEELHSLHRSNTEGAIGKKDAVYLMYAKKSSSWMHPRETGRSLRGSIGRSMIVVHPDSVQHLIWAGFGVIFLLLDVFYLTMSVFDLERSVYLGLADCIYWTLDVLFNFRLGFREQDQTVLSLPKIARRYLRTWFSFDIVLMAAGWLFALIDTISGPGTRVLRYFRLVRLTRLVRMSRFARILHELSFRFHSDVASLLFRVVMYMCFVGLWIHLSACAFYWISTNKDVWAAQWGGETTPQLAYIIAVHWAASQLQGSIDIYPSFDVRERVFVVSNLLGSIAVLALVVSKITTLLGAIQAEQHQRNMIFNTARRFADTNGVKAEVLLEVYRYLAKRRRYQAREKETEAEAELFSHLPFQLRRRLLEEARWPQLKSKLIFVAFGHVSKQFQTQLLCDVLQSAVHLPDHLVFQYGSICSRLYLMTSGEGHYTRYAKTFAALLSGESAIAAGLGGAAGADADVASIEQESKSSTSSPENFQMFEDRHRQLQGGEVRAGSLLSEFALWTPWLHKGDLEATGEVTMFTINIGAFGELVCHFASVQQHFRLHAHRVLNFLRTLEEPSDLNSSEHVMIELSSPGWNTPRFSSSKRSSRS